MNPRRVTMADVAAKLGVSRPTVSVALRGGYGVSAETRRKVQRMAKEMGYVPDPFLSGLAAFTRERSPAKEHGVLAWVNHWPDARQLRRYKEFDGYWRGASQAARRYGYRVEEVSWAHDCSAKRLERILLARGIQGVLIPPHSERLDWKDFNWANFSVIRFGTSVQNPDSNQVTADIFRGMVMAVQRIYEYGYRRIGFTVDETFNTRLGGDFLGGYFYAQSLLNLKAVLPPLLTNLNVPNHQKIESQKQAFARWLNRHKPDAILTADIPLPNLIRSLGLRIGKDIAVAGTSTLDVPVDAGIDQRSEVIGRIAVEMLVKQLNIGERGEPGAPCRIVVESRWQEGNSLPKR